jgi:hypothetical protein
MSATHCAASLEELADHFDSNAELARAAASRHATATRNILRREAATWERAARLLRDTKLEPSA